MAKLSASALRTAAANAREKSEENAVMNPSLHAVIEKKSSEETPKKEELVLEDKIEEEKPSEYDPEIVPTESRVKSVLRSYEGERKTEHVNLLITPSLSRKIETIQKQGEFRSKNAAVIAVLEAFCDANDIK